MSLARESAAAPRAVPTVTSSAASPGSPGPLTLLCVNEPLDGEGAARLLERTGPVSRTCGRLVLELTSVEYVDSDGVRVLLWLAEELEKGGKRLLLVVEPGSRVERTLRLLRLFERFRAFPTLASACQAAACTAAA